MMKKIITLSLMLFCFNAFSQNGQVKTTTGTADNFHYKDEKIGIGTANPQKGLHVINDAIIRSTSKGNWDDGLVIYNENNGWAGTVLHRHGTSGDASAKYWYGLRSGTNNFIMMGPVINNLGTSITPSRTDAAFELKCEGSDDRIDYYIPVCYGQNVGIGTTKPEVNMHIRYGSELSAYLRLESQHVGQNASVQFCSANTYRWELGTGISAQSAFELFDRTDGVSRLVVLDGGNVGIGTIKPAYKLDVWGTIRARELKVDMQGADFVFEENYPLRPISELEDFVKANKHLPEIAPAKDMQENGVNQSEMNKKLLQKIEELTLYVIKINQKNEILQKRVEELEQK